MPAMPATIPLLIEVPLVAVLIIGTILSRRRGTRRYLRSACIHPVLACIPLAGTSARRRLTGLGFRSRRGIEIRSAGFGGRIDLTFAGVSVRAGFAAGVVGAPPMKWTAAPATGASTFVHAWGKLEVMWSARRAIASGPL